MNSVLAAVFHGKDEAIELKQTPMPALPPGGVLVRVRCCTLCGSDIHTADGRRSAPVPLILGHEILGDIVEDVEAGSTVAVFGAFPRGSNLSHS